MTGERLADARDPARFRSLGHAVVDRLAEHLAAAGGRAIPVSRQVAPEGMAERWPAGFAGGADPLALVERILAESVVTHHPAYVGHQLAAPLPLAALGTLVAAITNGSGAIYELSQSSSACEAALAQHLAERLGLPATAGGMIVHGGSIATLTALLAARQAQAGFDVWRDGAQAGPPLALLTSDQAHYSTARAAQIMGLGEAGAIAVESDERFRMRPAALAAEIAAARTRGLRPIAVVATAGTTSTGAFDPLDEIADVCAAEGLWLHVDAAHGGSAALSPALAPQLAGIGRADSVVWDLHKTLPFPALASLLAYARARDAYGAFAQKADYLFRSDDPGAENMGTRTLECTRPQLALVAYLGFAAVGTDGMRVHVERLWELGAVLAELVRESDDFELALEPECNIVCFRHRALDASESDAHQERIRSEVNASGSYYLVQTRLRGSTWLRCALMNAETTRDDLLGLLDALRRSAARP
ncbi:MAG: L-2,4-diaminobutyrate decarboxylase [Gaiellales bacterium]|nr:L-2,4-diaminobutyrate decarboxylase [Gaiellales bacterium]